MTPPPLTKRSPTTGVLYQRPTEIEAALGRTLDFDREQIVRALDIRDRNDPRYIPSECLVHLLRRTRFDNRDTHFERLYKALMERVDRALPRAEHRMGDRMGLDLNRARIRDQVRDRFEMLLVQDRRQPGDRLDFFEVHFAYAIAKLRGTAKEKVYRDAGRQEPLVPVNESGELGLDAERAAGSLDAPSDEIWNDPTYRSRLDAAIDTLSPEQSRIITMARTGILMHSRDPKEVTISRILNCSEKTVYNRREAAIKALRLALRLEDQD